MRSVMSERRVEDRKGAKGGINVEVRVVGVAERADGRRVGSEGAAGSGS